jgi:hypothetical protein
LIDIKFLSQNQPQEANRSGRRRPELGAISQLIGRYAATNCHVGRCDWYNLASSAGNKAFVATGAQDGAEARSRR